jgi:proteasome lid subunit RPN8/RPN11
MRLEQIASAETEPWNPENDPPQQLLLTSSWAERILGHLRSTIPQEGCGLLATIRDDSGADRSVHFFPGTNIDASENRFTMAPHEVVDAFRTIREQGWRLGAIVHSHPASPPAPSPTDLREAYYPSSLLLIISFLDEPPAFQAWALTGGPGDRGFVERPVVIVDF